MTYFQDLTPYEYFAKYEPLTPVPLNVGWLSADMPYEIGRTSPDFQQKLLRFCQDEHQ